MNSVESIASRHLIFPTVYDSSHETISRQTKALHEECPHTDNDSISICSDCDSIHSIESKPCSNCYQCDACPYCNDVCGSPTCESCTNKSQDNERRNDRCFERCPEKSNCYTMCQVRRHNTSESAWLVAGNVIYDATEYIKFHPGGNESILKRAGGVKDCSIDMEFHSKSARRIWSKTKVGTLRPCPQTLVASMKPEDNQCVIC